MLHDGETLIEYDEWWVRISLWPIYVSSWSWSGTITLLVTLMVRVPIRMRRYLGFVCTPFWTWLILFFNQGDFGFLGRQWFPVSSAKWCHHWSSLLASLLQVFKEAHSQQLLVWNKSLIFGQAILEPRESPGGKYQWWTSAWNGEICIPKKHSHSRYIF